MEKAGKVGEAVGKKALSKKINKVVFDRGGFYLSRTGEGFSRRGAQSRSAILGEKSIWMGRKHRN